MSKPIDELRADLNALIEIDQAQRKSQIGSADFYSELTTQNLALISSVLAELATHDSRHAAWVIAILFSQPVIAYRLAAIKALSGMTVPDARHLIKRRRGFLSFAAREEKIAANQVLARIEPPSTVVVTDRQQHEVQNLSQVFEATQAMAKAGFSATFIGHLTDEQKIDWLKERESASGSVINGQKTSSDSSPGPLLDGGGDRETGQVVPSPRSRHAVVDKFDPGRDVAKDIETAVVEARASGRHVLVDVGGSWCGWCRTMDRFFAEQEDLRAERNANYVLVRVDFDPSGENRALANFPAITNVPHFFVLDGIGTLLHSQATAVLESGKTYDVMKFRSFLRDWAPGARKAGVTATQSPSTQRSSVEEASSPSTSDFRVLSNANQFLRYRARSRAKVDAQISLMEALLARPDVPPIKVSLLSSADPNDEFPWLIVKSGTREAVNAMRRYAGFDPTFKSLFGDQPFSIVWADHVAENCPGPGETVTPLGQERYAQLERAIRDGKYVFERQVGGATS